MNDLVLKICVLLLVFCLVMLIKNENTFRKQMIISNAIYLYNLDCIHGGRYPEEKIEWEEMEHYFKTMFRIWDWGYTRILPPDRFELIKPFIQ